MRQELLIFRARLDEVKNLTLSRSSEIFIRELEKLKKKHGPKLCPFEKIHPMNQTNKQESQKIMKYIDVFQEMGIDISKGLIKVFFHFFTQYFLIRYPLSIFLDL